MKLAGLTFILLILHPPHLAAQEWGAEVEGIATRLSAPSIEMKIGTPIIVKLEIANRGNSIGVPCSESGLHTPFQSPPIIIKRIDGFEPPILTRPYQEDAGSNDQKILRIGETITLLNQFDLREVYLLNAPGKYRVYFPRSGDYPESNSLEIELNPGKPLPSEIFWQKLQDKNSGLATKWVLSGSVLPQKIPNSRCSSLTTASLTYGRMMQPTATMNVEVIDCERDIPAAFKNYEPLGKGSIGFTYFKSAGDYEQYWPGARSELKSWLGLNQ